MTDQLSEAVGKGLVAGLVGIIGYVIFYIINKVREKSSKNENCDDDKLSVSANTFSNTNRLRMKQFIWVGIFFIALSVFVFKLATKSHTPQYASYEDCLLQNVKDAQSDTAARLVHGACRKLFPEPGKYDDIFGVTTQAQK